MKKFLNVYKKTRAIKNEKTDVECRHCGRMGVMRGVLLSDDRKADYCPSCKVVTPVVSR